MCVHVYVICLCHVHVHVVTEVVKEESKNNTCTCRLLDFRSTMINCCHKASINGLLLHVRSHIMHCKNKIVKITNLHVLVTTVSRNNGNCNLIGRVGYYDCMVTNYSNFNYMYPY